MKQQESITEETMTKKKISIEYGLSCRSERIIWPLLSTPAGLTKWLADEVTAEGDILTFTWGEVWSHHEVRSARIIDKVPYSYIRLQWVNEEDPDAYLEMRIEKGDITDDFVLLITDFADEDDVDVLKDIWTANLERLHTSTGL